MHIKHKQNTLRQRRQNQQTLTPFLFGLRFILISFYYVGSLDFFFHSVSSSFSHQSLAFNIVLFTRRFFFYLIWFTRSTEFYSKVNKQRATMNKLLILKTTNTYLLRANCVRTFKPVCILYMCCHVLNVFVVVVGIFAVYILSN